MESIDQGEFYADCGNIKKPVYIVYCKIINFRGGFIFVEFVWTINPQILMSTKYEKV